MPCHGGCLNIYGKPFLRRLRKKCSNEKMKLFHNLCRLRVDGIITMLVQVEAKLKLQHETMEEA